ncbi:polysaccharide lyase [Pontibacter chinhatensis]|uniref:Polysaccharide lyase n=1 Tax=Pontibacter chinhatensis TaxID=1436961 RepID=A0A1I2N2W6_9BACT|nr:polysaccharide lyase [Pontibacter chinhatensis]SFF97199.1 Polysaccharide lyase [Pontibacter chinhatensis]
MNSRFKYILMPLLVGTITMSCEKEELEDMTPTAELGTEATDLATSANLIFNETFESGNGFSGIKHQSSTNYGFSVVSNPAFEGSKAGRFELRDTDAEASGGTRTEFLFPEDTRAKEGWYSFAGYFPSSDYADEKSRDIITQWHQGGGSGSPHTVLVVENGEFIMHVGEARLPLGKMTKNVWHKFVIHMVHSGGSDGLIEVWLNDKKVASRSGATIKSGYELPRWKVGIYKWDWNGSETTNTKKRVWYIDNVKLGNSKASLSEMSSGSGSGSGSVTEPAPSPSEPSSPDAGTSAPSSSADISGFTLIDSHYEKGVMPITNGAQISLSQLEYTKLNVQANTSSSVESVKFELSGAQSKTFTDNAAPFALHGDDGKGNFYYGNWNPPAAGTYTLKATPYKNGQAGTPVSVTFTIVNTGEHITPENGGSTSGSNETALPSTSSDITGFTLIDSHTEKGVQSIADGSVIKLSSLAYTKLNIQANTASSVENVKFELSGAQSKTYTDKGAPFALHGDDGNGNFYYGNWNPPATGTYTLKATPYTNGQAGTPVTIKFTIQK